MTILGIDPGSQVVGFGVINVHSGSNLEHRGHGTLALDLSQNFSSRLAELCRRLRTVIETYQPQVVVVESIFLGKNIQSAFKLGHARGVIMAEATLSGCQVFEYPTRLVKKGITGTGAAEKDHVRQVLQLLLNLREIKSLDASDGLAMAYFHGLELQKQTLHSQLIEGSR
jgi:crossover junction endodeoxyribonuclease RuvC